MAVLDLDAGEHELRLAREQALYALEDHGIDAEMRLSQKAEQTRSRTHRLIYRLAVDEVRKLRA
jgi:hypothetical protein